VRAFVLTGPREFEVQDVAPPVATPGGVVIDVQRVGVCGTDVEFFTGEMQYLSDGFAEFPMRLGHEWMGTVCAVGVGVACRATNTSASSDSRSASAVDFPARSRNNWPCR
jgi:threonine dehydrogenase-like Zn-dependent dehydrogenase